MKKSDKAFAVNSVDLETIFNTVDWSRIPPPPDFDEAAYLAEYSDVAKEVAAGSLRSGFEHYMRWGRAEGRRRPLANR